MEASSASKTVETLDCKGLLCPVPIIRLAKAIKAISVGQAIEMFATDPGSVPDMEAFQKQTGHMLLANEKQGNVFRFVVQRAK